MVWLPDGEQISKISLFVLTTHERDRHTDRQTDTHTQTPHDDIGRTYASHRAAKILERINIWCIHFFLHQVVPTTTRSLGEEVET